MLFIKRSITIYILHIIAGYTIRSILAFIFGRWLWIFAIIQFLYQWILKIYIRITSVEHFRMNTLYCLVSLYKVINIIVKTKSSFLRYIWVRQKSLIRWWQYCNQLIANKFFHITMRSKVKLIKSCVIHVLGRSASRWVF